MLKCGTENLRNSCRWHPPWTNENCDLSALARKIFSAGLPPRTPPGMNSHLSATVHTWKTHRIWATCLGDPGPLADDHGAPRDPPCGGLHPLVYSAVYCSLLQPTAASSNIPEFSPIYPDFAQSTPVWPRGCEDYIGVDCGRLDAVDRPCEEPVQSSAASSSLPQSTAVYHLAIPRNIAMNLSRPR